MKRRLDTPGNHVAPLRPPSEIPYVIAPSRYCLRVRPMKIALIHPASARPGIPRSNLRSARQSPPAADPKNRGTRIRQSSGMNGIKHGGLPLRALLPPFALFLQRPCAIRNILMQAWAAKLTSIMRILIIGHKPLRGSPAELSGPDARPALPGRIAASLGLRPRPDPFAIELGMPGKTATLTVSPEYKNDHAHGQRHAAPASTFQRTPRFTRPASPRYSLADAGLLGLLLFATDSPEPHYAAARADDQLINTQAAKPQPAPTTQAATQAAAASPDRHPGDEPPESLVVKPLPPPPGTGGQADGPPHRATARASRIVPVPAAEHQTLPVPSRPRRRAPGDG